MKIEYTLNKETKVFTAMKPKEKIKGEHYGKEVGKIIVFRDEAEKLVGYEILDSTDYSAVKARTKES